MEQLKVDSVIRALQDAGYAAAHGFPQGTVPTVTGPVCAVDLHTADLAENRITVTVQVLSPMELGAAVCEQTALEVGAILKEQGGACTLTSCGYDSRIGMFSVEVQAAYDGEKPAVLLDGSLCRHARGFSAWKELSGTETDWGEAIWHFQLEEWFDPEEEEQLAPEGSFTLTCNEGKGVETFTGAAWNYRKRQWEHGGIRQIRRGTAASRTFTPT